jgi:hypothetical protein
MTKSAARRRLAAVCIGAVAAAIAQAASAQTVLRSPRDIAACLCEEQNVSGLKAEVDRQKQAYDGAKANYDALNSQAEAGRAQVNVNDSNSIAAYRQMLERRDAAEYHYKVEVTPGYSAAVARYNQAVQAYNAGCGTKMYDSVALAEVKKTLYCPR